MMSSAASSTSPVSGSRQSSMSTTPTIGSSSVKTNPTPSACFVSVYSSAVSKLAQSPDLLMTRTPSPGVTGIFVGLPSRSASRQHTHWSRSRSVSGIASDSSMILLLMFFKYLAWLTGSEPAQTSRCSASLSISLVPTGTPCSILVGFAVTDHSNTQNPGLRHPIRVYGKISPACLCYGISVDCRNPLLSADFGSVETIYIAVAVI